MKNNYGNLLVNQNPNSPHYGKALALHWVVKMGADCDGYDSGVSITPFGCSDLAITYCDSCNHWSDGCTYFVISNVRKLVDLCNEYGISIEHYLFADSVCDQDTLIRYYETLDLNISQFYSNHQINLTDYSTPNQ